MPSTDLTIDMLAAELGTSRRTIERALEAGDLVPTYRTTGGRARFSRELADKLRVKGDQARAAGRKYVVFAALSDHVEAAPRRKRKTAPLSPQQWAARALWKLQNLRRTSKHGSPPAAARSAGPSEPHRKPASSAGRESRLLGMRSRGLAERPTSAARAIDILRAIENVARGQSSSAGDDVKRSAARLAYRLKHGTAGRKDTVELKRLRELSMSFDRESYHFLCEAIANLLDWYGTKGS